ncbi:MauE/DoxX family redox-associated membrane protein [Massilia sp. CCM 8734]|uniref:MauE/DoxX family redox-associated membrane protein n=1 Tax=Massilia sp. CCM 8734 TaxID=2609283 RepID=UPI00141F60A2|nr:MauE/DoxX family redox-associated membrane protein [Massilia sp. CCM 8734]
MSAAAYLAEIIRFCTAFLLVCAAIGKLRTLSAFTHNLVESFGVKRQAAALLAPAVIAAEALLAGLILAGGGIGRIGMAAALVLFVVLTALVGYRYVVEGSVKCSCFGESERPVSGYDLLRNGLVIAAIGACLALPGGAAFGKKESVLAAALATIATIGAIGFHDLARAFKRSA